MRAAWWCVAVAAAVTAAGCVHKGPYYIYGDYIEEHGAADFGGDEYPPEETAPAGEPGAEDPQREEGAGALS